MLKPELLLLAKANQGSKKYVVDEMAKAHGSEVIRLPPYHCHFNPIEMAWGFMKEWVAKRNRDGRLESVKRLFNEAKLEAIDRSLWEGWCRHVKDIEEKQWEKDRKIDEAEPLVIFVGEDEEEEEEEEELEDYEVDEEEQLAEVGVGSGDTSFGIGLDDSGLDDSVLNISGVGVLGDESVLETSVEINMEDLGEGTSGGERRLDHAGKIDSSCGKKRKSSTVSKGMKGHKHGKADTGKGGKVDKGKGGKIDKGKGGKIDKGKGGKIDKGKGGKIEKGVGSRKRVRNDSDKENIPVISCLVCRSPDGPNNKWIGCDLCDVGWYHKACLTP